jgi:hypothetical protein
MKRFPKLSVALIAFATSAFALASCHAGGGSGYVPSSGAPAAPQMVARNQASNELFPADPTLADNAPPLPVPVPAELIPSSKTTPLPPCPTETVPGTYISIIAPGTVNSAKTTFTANSSSTWELIKYVVATPSPTPKPTPTPTPKQPEYLYEGTFIIKDGTKTEGVGCASLLTTQDGADLKGLKFNGLNGEYPIFTKHTHFTTLMFGAVTKLTITGITATSGSGTFTLSNKDTGTLKLTSRLTLK